MGYTIDIPALARSIARKLDPAYDLRLKRMGIFDFEEDKDQ